VPHGIARRAERSVLARPWGVETRAGVKQDGNQTVHNWRSMLPSRNGSFCQSLVDVQRLVPKSVTVAFFVFFSRKLYQLLPTQSSAQTEPVEVHGRVLGSVLLASFSKDGPVTELIQF